MIALYSGLILIIRSTERGRAAERQVVGCTHSVIRLKGQDD